MFYIKKKVTGIYRLVQQHRIITLYASYVRVSWLEINFFFLSVRPRLYSQEPKAVEVGKDSIQLSWRPAELPQFARHKLPIRYMVEMRTLPSSSWEPVARNVHDTSYLVKGLRSDKEYQFRIKALTDFGNSEPSFPVTVYRKSGRNKFYSLF